MKALVLTVAAFATTWAFAQSQPAPDPVRVHSVTGKVIELADFESKILGNKRNIHVWLPPDFALSSGRFSVLYMNDGQNCFDGFTSFIPNQEWRADETAYGLVKGGLVPSLIIVAIDNAGADRANEFLPTRSKVQGTEAGGNAEKYLEFVTKELKPYIDGHFRTYTDAEHTSMCGSSFGGIVTLTAAFNHSDVFGNAMIMSPSLWWDDKVMLKQAEKLTRKLPVKIWLDMGTAESVTGAGESAALYASLRKAGWRPGQDLTYFEDGGAKHNEVAWSRRFGMALLFLFGRKA